MQLLANGQGDRQLSPRKVGWDRLSVWFTRQTIPLSARIVAIADVYDALRSRRAYKDSLKHETAVEIIEAGSGSQFDPALIDIFLKIQFHFFEISEALANGSTPDETLELQNV